MIEQSWFKELSIGLEKAEELPGKIGLARRTHLNKLKSNIQHIDDYVIELIKADDKNIVIEREDEIYFYVKNEKNTLVFKLGKIFNVAQEVEIDELSDVLYQSFAKRGKIDPKKYPPIDVIKEFIEKYEYTNVVDGIVTYQGAKNNLVPIESAIVEFFKDHSTAKWGKLKTYLRERQIGDARISDVYSLSILYKQGPRRNQIFSLVGNTNLNALIEDAAQGGITGSRALRKKRKVSAQELADAQRKLKDIGKKGEVLVHSYLKEQKDKGIIQDVVYDAETNAVAPHDFTITELNGSITWVDAKSTDGRFSNIIHISFGQLYDMQESERYFIYRVYEIKNQARMRISENLKGFSNTLINVIDLPLGITPDSFSISPSACKIIKFEDDEIILTKSVSR